MPSLSAAVAARLKVAGAGADVSQLAGAVRLQGAGGIVQQDTRGLLQFPATITIPAGQGYSNWFDVPVTAR